MILLSPAKIQQFRKKTENNLYSFHAFPSESSSLIKLLRKLSSSEISKLLNINSQLTQLNLDRYVQWNTPFTPENSMQAIYVFDGEVFRGLGGITLNDAELSYAQAHLRIFSGLYGLLKPMDLIQPYRLEVSTPLQNKSGSDLYPFWKKKITDHIVKELSAQKNDSIIFNLSSAEYFKMLDLKRIKCPVIHFEFLEYKNDEFKQIVIYTKKARGLMARYIIQHQITDPKQLTGFNDAGYWYHPDLSGENKYVFIR
jgi:cytoplasmic iron level regulating protein YaaA (DUF328/UPF0246 family)